MVAGGRELKFVDAEVLHRHAVPAAKRHVQRTYPAASRHVPYTCPVAGGDNAVIANVDVAGLDQTGTGQARLVGLFGPEVFTQTENTVDVKNHIVPADLEPPGLEQTAGLNVHLAVVETEVSEVAAVLHQDLAVLLDGEPGIVVVLHLEVVLGMHQALLGRRAGDGHAGTFPDIEPVVGEYRAVDHARGGLAVAETEPVCSNPTAVLDSHMVSALDPHLVPTAAAQDTLVAGGKLAAVEDGHRPLADVEIRVVGKHLTGDVRREPTTNVDVMGGGPAACLDGHAHSAAVKMDVTVGILCRIIRIVSTV